MLHRPIIVLGAARSGTTLLGHLLGKHPEVAFWDEPAHIWRHRHAYRRHDVLTAVDATPAVIRYIRKQFERFLDRTGRRRFAEKTPSNCFRVPFIRKIFPDARFVHLVRDGRAATVSAMGQWLNDMTVRPEADRAGRVMNTSYGDARNGLGPQWVGEAGYVIRKFLRDKRRLTGGIWMVLEAPAQLPGLGRVIARKLTRDRSYLWGPRFRGIAAVHRTHSLLETCALQWAHSVQAVQAHTNDLPADRLLELRFEELILNPAETIRRVCDFADLEWCDPIEAAVATVDRSGDGERWRQAISPAEADLLETRLSPLLAGLGYRPTAP